MIDQVVDTGFKYNKLIPIFTFGYFQVLNQCVEAEAWLREKKQHQDSLPKHATPVLLSADVRRKAEALDRYTLVTLLKLRFSF